jgi:PBP1b-binding outer membrane lipoprotein LpoB
MKQYVVVGSVAALLAAALAACSGMGSATKGLSAYQQLGGSQSLSSISSGFVNSSLKDPRLSALTAGRSIDPTAASSRVSSQLCSMLGGGCKAPMSDSQLSAAASKLTPAQSQAISENFSSSLNSVVGDPKVQQLVTSSLGSKLPGVLGGAL